MCTKFMTKEILPPIAPHSVLKNMYLWIGKLALKFHELNRCDDIDFSTPFLVLMCIGLKPENEV